MSDEPDSKIRIELASVIFAQANHVRRLPRGQNSLEHRSVPLLLPRDRGRVAHNLNQRRRKERPPSRSGPSERLAAGKHFILSKAWLRRSPPNPETRAPSPDQRQYPGSGRISCTEFAIPTCSHRDGV